MKFMETFREQVKEATKQCTADNRCGILAVSYTANGDGTIDINIGIAGTARSTASVIKAVLDDNPNIAKELAMLCFNAMQSERNSADKIQ